MSQAMNQTQPEWLADLTQCPRFGVKGTGAAAWLAVQGLPVPPVNRIAAAGGLRVLRLGGEDFLLTAEVDPGALATVVAAWRTSAGPKGYQSWREEGWAWLRLAGPDRDGALAALCALDLRPAAFPADAIAQTRVAHLDAVLVHSADGAGYELFFDIASAAYMVRAIRVAAGAAA